MLRALAPKRLDLASQQLKGFELGSKALIERRKEIARLLVNEAIFEASIDPSDESLPSKRRYLESAVEYVLIAKQSWSSYVAG
jgi:hypothetical protein